MFSTHPITNLNFRVTFILLSAKCFQSELCKVSVIYFSNGLTLPNKKFLDCPDSKALNADNKINVTRKFIFVLERLENIVGKGEKCWLSAFSPFPTMFLKDR